MSFPVYLSGSWVLLALLVTIIYGGNVAQRHPDLGPTVAYLIGFGFVVCLGVSVLLHELGHALTCRYHGIGVRAITLELLGGYTVMEREAPRPGVEATIALAGPAVSLLLGAAGVAVVVAVPDGSIAWELAFQFAFSNLVVAVFNILPGLPLDGGRALRAVVWAITHDRYRGTWAAGWAGRVVAVIALLGAMVGYTARVLNLFGVVFALMVVGVLWAGATQAVQFGRLGRRLPSIRVVDLVRTAIGVPSQTPLAEALRRADEARATAVLVTDASGRPVGLVNDHAVAAMPTERRPWVAVDAVARSLSPGLVLPVDLTGEDVLRAVQAHPASEYLVVSGDTVVGVLRAADLASALTSRPPRSV